MGGRAVIGHQPLLAMRRKGTRPAQGVRIDAGHIDPLAPVVWSRERRSMAVVRVSDDDASPDFRFIRALPVLVVLETSMPQAWADSLIAALWAQYPASLTVLHLEARFGDESSWCPVDAYEITPDALIDRSPVLTYAKAFS